jgi:transcriptional regulator with XRE-family HTH domain
VPTSDTTAATGRHEELGRLLVRLRTERDLAQKEVARRAEIDGSTLSRLESGDRGISRDVLDRICRVLELTRRERLAVLVAAGLLTDEAARLLADDDLARLARLLTGGSLDAATTATLRQYVSLALAHACALGYDIELD